MGELRSAIYHLHPMQQRVKTPRAPRALPPSALLHHVQRLLVEIRSLEAILKVFQILGDGGSSAVKDLKCNPNTEMDGQIRPNIGKHSCSPRDGRVQGWESECCWVGVGMLRGFLVSWFRNFKVSNFRNFNDPILPTFHFMFP